MNLVFFAHPTFLSHQSMPRFAKMLADGMAERGHTTEIWSPGAVFYKLPAVPFVRKWLGYIDQYLVFPGEIRRRIKQLPSDTLFVFTDQALGPWVPTVADRPHVIHCHDFLALRSALGELPENPTGWTGKQYQKLIRRGFSRGKHFISVSNKTKEDLHRYLPERPPSSDVVYNGFHQPFFPVDKDEARSKFGKRVNLDLTSGYILHVGGNLWYKNRLGVIEIYNAWRSKTPHALPLLMIGEAPTEELVSIQKKSPYAKDIYWLSNVEDQFVRLAYSGASVFLFPSLGEGFGWPIAEAMASGSPVITTGEAPMSEVAGNAAFLIPRRPGDEAGASEWATDAASQLTKILNLSIGERENIVATGLENAKRFNTQEAMDKIEKIYFKIVSNKT
ncbi:MAG TPA: glycosyltransferase family 1 protein [Chryseolinea sp.]|nr:glycosyltransferase family 1 protein [Chryseolinea sp.]